MLDNSYMYVHVLLSQLTSWFDLSQIITVGFDFDVGY